MSSVQVRMTVPRCLLLLCLSALAWSQVQNASLTGLVTDPSGAIVPGASVTAVQTSINLQQESKTDSAGYYLFPALPAGNGHSQGESVGGAGRSSVEASQRGG